MDSDFDDSLVAREALASPLSHLLSLALDFTYRNFRYIGRWKWTSILSYATYSSLTLWKTSDWMISSGFYYHVYPACFLLFYQPLCFCQYRGKSSIPWEKEKKAKKRYLAWHISYAIRACPLASQEKEPLRSVGFFRSSLHARFTSATKFNKLFMLIHRLCWFLSKSPVRRFLLIHIWSLIISIREFCRSLRERYPATMVWGEIGPGP